MALKIDSTTHLKSADHRQLSMCSLGWVYKRHKQEKSEKEAPPLDDYENKKKRPSSDKTSPEQTKRAKTAYIPTSNDSNGYHSHAMSLLKVQKGQTDSRSSAGGS